MKLHTKRKAFIQIVWVSPQPSLTGLPSGTTVGLPYAKLRESKSAKNTGMPQLNQPT